MKKRRKYILRSIYLLPLLLLLGGTIPVCLQIRQASLDSALISAIKGRDVLKAVRLLDEGANANAVDPSGNPRTIQVLIAEFWDRLRGRKAQNIRNGIPALMLACENTESIVWPPGYKVPLKRNVSRPADLPLLSALLRHGADPNAVDKTNGVTALYSQVVADSPATVKLLLEAGSSPNGAAPTAQMPITPLINAVAGNETEITSLLLQHGVAINAHGPNGMTAVHMAMSVGSEKTLNLLLSYHADVNAQDSDGWTPLMYDNLWRLEKIRALVQHGARVLLKNNNGDTALDRARVETPESRRKTEILLILTEAARREAAGH